MKEILAIAGAILITLCTIPYVIDTLKGKTKPNIVTWVTWTMLTAVATAAAFAAHEPRTAIFTLGSAVSTGVVILAGLRNGFAKYSIFDGLCQAGIIVGFILWLIFNSPSIAIIAAVSLDFMAMLPTLRHSWIKPREETWETYLINTIASILVLVALKDYSTPSLAYPLYLFAADLIITATILYRRKAKPA